MWERGNAPLFWSDIAKSIALCKRNRIISTTLAAGLSSETTAGRGAYEETAMTVLTIEAVIAWLTRLIEELKQAEAQVNALLAQLVAQGQAAADQLDDLCLVGG